MPESIKYLSGGEQTTINATITELFPAIAFNTGENPKTPKEMEDFVSNVDLGVSDVMESFVNKSNIAAAEEYINSINRIKPNIKNTKLQNSIAVSYTHLTLPTTPYV